MVALGSFIAAILIYRRAPHFNLDKDKMLDLVIVMLLSGIIGARSLYVMLNINYYISNPFEVIDLSKGGLVWYGGFLFGLIMVLSYLKLNRMNFWSATDLIAPYIALAQAIGRIGCFLNGCCYGTEVGPGYPIGICFPGSAVYRHPTELYSAAALVVIFFVLRIWQDKVHFTGEIFLAYGVLYSLKRFLIEFLRGDNPRVIYGLTLSQCISLVIFIISLAALIYKGALWKRTSR
jgi:phosphatidylglycerol:prolipoprotein diacylglycerol transferase